MWIKIEEVLELILGARQRVRVKNWRRGISRRRRRGQKVGGHQLSTEPREQRVGQRGEGGLSEAADRGRGCQGREGTIGSRSMEVTGGLGQSSPGGMGEAETSLVLEALRRRGLLIPVNR